MSIPLAWDRVTYAGLLASHETRAFSGARKLACFCTTCGTRMWHRSSEDSIWITLKVGTLDRAAEIEPHGHLWISKKQPWVVLDPDLPAFDTQPEDVQKWRLNLKWTKC
jgi:hypothetical protein